MPEQKSPWIDRQKKLFLGKRGSVAVLVALSAPVLIMAIALAVEATGWSVTQQRLQRAADMAALAGALAYRNGTSAQLAATQAAAVAEMNGGQGGSPNWTTPTYTDNMITIQMTGGVRNPSSTAFKATIKTTVPFLFSASVLHGAGKTITATATAESNGPQPCLVTLGGDINGVTTGTDVTVSGNVSINANGCSIRSDASVSLSGNVAIHTAAIYASGAITSSGNVTVTGAEFSGQPQISDPYANWPPVQNALAAAACSGGTAVNYSSGSPPSLSPGCYSGINVSGNTTITLNPGIYYVNGGVNLSGNVSLSGSNVTIASTGIFSTSGNVNISLTAPLTGPTAGIVYASSYSNGSSFNGNQAMTFTGLIYYPNGILSFSGNATDGSTGCAEVVAQTVNLSGNANLSANCSGYGLPTYGSLPGTTPVALVQ